MPFLALQYIKFIKGVNTMNKQKKNEKGFTMVELVIVVAIMGIIGALLVPAFGTMSSKARLSTDISTVKTLKRTADTYKAEKGSWPSGSTLSTLTSTLKSDGYLEADAVLQTKGGIIITSETIKLSLTTDQKSEYSKAIAQLDSQTKTDWIN